MFRISRSNNHTFLIEYISNDAQGREKKRILPIKPINIYLCFFISRVYLYNIYINSRVYFYLKAMYRLCLYKYRVPALLLIVSSTIKIQPTY